MTVGARRLSRFFRFHLPLGLFLIFLLFPFYWMTLTAFRPDKELLDPNANPFVIHGLTREHIERLLRQTPFLQWISNTFMIAVGATLISLVASLLAAYAIERIRFRGANVLGSAIFLAYLVPPTILFIPLAVMVFRLGLWDTPWALILTYPTFLIPFATWLLMGYFNSIPRELEESAALDGAGRLQTLFRIVLPVSVPGILSALIFSFTLSWNEYLYALVFLSSSENKTAPVGIVTELIRGDVYSWGPLMAGALLSSVPVALAYSFFVDHYVAGLAGALKD